MTYANVTISFTNWHEQHKDIQEWLTLTDTWCSLPIWPSTQYTFEDEASALAFMLRFNGVRTYSKIEQMIKDAYEANSY